MIFLQNTGLDTVDIILAGAKNTNDAQFLATYQDESILQATGDRLPVPGRNASTTNGVGAKNVVPAAAMPGYIRKLKTFQLVNLDLAAITLTLRYNISGTGTTAIQQVTLQTLEQMEYEDGYGFSYWDANGAIKSQAAATSSATSTAQLLATSAWSVLQQINAPASVLSTSSQASSIAAAIVPASINSVSSQASSLAAAIVVASVNSVSSQASSIATNNPAAVSSLQSAASVQSFTSTNWQTVSSAASRVKSSFGW